MYLACHAGHFDMVKYLFALGSKGPGRDERTRGGETPLMAAIRSANPHVVTLCLNNKCNPFLDNCLG